MRHRPPLAKNIIMSVAVFIMAGLTVMSYVRISSLAHDGVYPPFQRLPSATQPWDRRTRGAVSSENKLCSEAGIDMLHAGGNAADAVRLSAYLFT
jgi:hypothetical protein